MSFLDLKNDKSDRQKLYDLTEEEFARWATVNLPISWCSRCEINWATRTNNKYFQREMMLVYLTCPCCRNTPLCSSQTYKEIQAKKLAEAERSNRPSYPTECEWEQMERQRERERIIELRYSPKLQFLEECRQVEKYRKSRGYSEED